MQLIIEIGPVHISDSCEHNNACPGFFETV